MPIEFEYWQGDRQRDLRGIAYFVHFRAAAVCLVQLLVPGTPSTSRGFRIPYWHVIPTKADEWGTAFSHPVRRRRNLLLDFRISACCAAMLSPSLGTAALYSLPLRFRCFSKRISRETDSEWLGVRNVKRGRFCVATFVLQYVLY